MKGKHFTRYDRNEIAKLLKSGMSLQNIADRLGKQKSAVWYEIKRNSRSKTSQYGEPEVYDPEVAQQKAYVKRKYAKYQGMKIMSHSKLKDFVDGCLLNHQTPSAIAGRLKIGREKLPYVSRSAIEKYLNSPFGSHIKFEVDRFKRQFRRRKKRPNVDKLTNRTFIDERPDIIANRDRIGDVEMDFIVSGRDGEGYLLTVIDRRSRKSFIRKLLPVTIKGLTELLISIKEEFPELKSITTDNDILLSQHNLLSEILNVPIYFCHPYSSWEKGSIENLNKFIRRFIRKGSNISSYTKSLIDKIETLANSRFMEVLGFLTPDEFLEIERLSVVERSD